MTASGSQLIKRWDPCAAIDHQGQLKVYYLRSTDQTGPFFLVKNKLMRMTSAYGSVEETVLDLGTINGSWVGLIDSEWWAFVSFNVTVADRGPDQRIWIMEGDEDGLGFKKLADLPPPEAITSKDGRYGWRDPFVVTQYNAVYVFTTTCGSKRWGKRGTIRLMRSSKGVLGPYEDLGDVFDDPRFGEVERCQVFQCDDGYLMTFSCRQPHRSVVGDDHWQFYAISDHIEGPYITQGAIASDGYGWQAVQDPQAGCWYYVGWRKQEGLHLMIKQSQQNPFEKIEQGQHVWTPRVR